MPARGVMNEILKAFKEALIEVSPRICVEKALKIRDGNKLPINNREYLLNRNVRIVAAGKAALQMVVGAEYALKEHVFDGIASVPIGTSVPTSLKTKFYEAAEHNLPDRLAVENTDRIFEFLNNSCTPNPLVLFLISGGASALLCSPTDGISLEDKLEVTRLLASNGADITELNTVRIVLSKVKGGKLAQKAAFSKSISLIISDIVGGRIDKVGSGPTVQQDIDIQKVKGVLAERGVWNQIPLSVRSYLEKPPEINEKPIQVDVENMLICDNKVLLESFKRHLESKEISTTIINTELEGNAQEVGEQFAEPLLQWVQGRSELSIPFNKNSCQPPDSIRRFAWLYGGETTVRFPSNFSNTRGGRNQEMVLSAFNKLRADLTTSSFQMRSDRRFYFTSLGSDGQDGPTDATGAFITNEDLKSSDSELERSTAYLNNKDSYTFWSKFHNGEHLIKTGKTGNNLMDVQLLLFEHI